MDIAFLGHASFFLKTKTATIITDPFDPSLVGFKYPKISADIVTVSHGHADHNQTQLVSGVKKVISGAGEYEVAGVSIIGLASYHDDQKGQERGTNTIYVIEAEDLRIAHLGDLGHILTENQIGGIGEIDILMIPVGGKFTIGSREAAEVVKAVEPKVIIPMHYQTQGLNPQTFSQLETVDSFVAQIGFKVEKLSKLKISRDSLPSEEQLIILLEKK